jgi:heme oxygenase
MQAHLQNRALLRETTRVTHDLAESSWSQGGSKAFPLESFLIAMRRLHTRLGMSAALCIGSKEFFAVEDARLDALRKDLGHEPRESAGAEPLSSSDKNNAWGVLYALNGSAMGASKLLRSGVGPSAYLDLMRSYATSGALSRFFRSLNAEPLDQSAAIKGARSVFASMALDHLGTEEQWHGHVAD